MRTEEENNSEAIKNNQKKIPEKNILFFFTWK